MKSSGYKDWASFEQVGSDTFRYDTRVYLDPIGAPSQQDVCIGAVVGKNPGSARPLYASKSGLQPIDLGGDKLIPNVRSIVRKAYVLAAKTPPANAYIQILNLFYLCNPDLEMAIKRIKIHSTAKVCPSETNIFPWIWYVWGSHSDDLSLFKGRFATLMSNTHFFVNTASGLVVHSRATEDSSARHTQGLSHDLIVPALRRIV